MGDIDRGQASSIPAWTGTVVFSPNTDNLRDLNKMCIPILILLLQISGGSYGLGDTTLQKIFNASISQLVS